MSSLDKLKEAADKAAERAAQAKKRLLLAQQREKKKLSSEERKRDARKKVLLGAWVMSSMTQEEIQEHMNVYLTRDSDRELFGLAPKLADASNSPEAEQQQQQHGVVTSQS